MIQVTKVVSHDKLGVVLAAIRVSIHAVMTIILYYVLADFGFYHQAIC